MPYGTKSSDINDNQVEFYNKVNAFYESYVAAKNNKDTKWMADHGYEPDGSATTENAKWLLNMGTLTDYHGGTMRERAVEWYHNLMAGQEMGQGFNDFLATPGGAKFLEAMNVADRDPQDALRRLSLGSGIFIDGGYGSLADFQNELRGSQPGADTKNPAADSGTHTPDQIDTELWSMYKDLQKAGYDPSSTQTGKNIMNKLAGQGAMAAGAAGGGSSGYSVGSTQQMVAGGLGDYAQKSQQQAAGILGQLGQHQGQQQNYGLGLAGMNLNYQKFAQSQVDAAYQRQQDALARGDALKAAQEAKTLAWFSAIAGVVSPLGGAAAKGLGGASGGGSGGSSGGGGGGGGGTTTTGSPSEGDYTITNPDGSSTSGGVSDTSSGGGGD